MEPITRVKGYKERRMVSSDVGKKGDLLELIVVLLEAFPFNLFVLGVDGDGEGGIFWIRCERRGVGDVESICSLL